MGGPWSIQGQGKAAGGNLSRCIDVANKRQALASLGRANEQMQSKSWRYGFATLSAAALVVGAAAFVLLARQPCSVQAGASQSQRESMATGVASLGRLPAFHVLFWSFLICGFTTTAVIETHLLPYASFCGFPPLPSATAYGCCWRSISAAWCWPAG